jgi:hypothetical protein
MLDDFLCNRRGGASLQVLKPVRKPEVLEAFDMDEEDEDFFLLAILEQEREHRREIGILGWWPIYEFNQRVRFDEAFAQRVAIVEVIIGLAVIPLYVIYVLPVVLRLGWMIVQAGFATVQAMLGW